MSGDTNLVKPLEGIRVVRTVAELRDALTPIRRAGRRIGLVPTMGALHEGHLSLVRAARRECDFCVATIFVNPAQFGPQEDLARYPRTLDSDLELLGREKTDLVFVPPESEVYPRGFSTYVEPPDVAKPLEGHFRPGHFRGVATVVLKLFQMVPSDVAYFGQKDYQQCLVIRHMVRDFDVPTEIRVCPIVREPDGLAMSSRNRYLSETERAKALVISKSLSAGADCIQGGERSVAEVERRMRTMIQTAGVDSIEYVTVRHPDTLDELREVAGPVVLLVAVFVGKTRLIDNWIVE